MKPSRFSDTEMRQAISLVDSGTPLVAMCRTLGVTQTTFYRWRRKHASAEPVVRDEMRALRDENNKLKQLVADLSLEKQSLEESLAARARSGRRS